MKFTLAAASLATVSSVDLCLGPTYSAFVQGFRLANTIEHHRPEEYNQADVFQIWTDASQEKSLIHLHDDSSTHGFAAHGFLSDYKDKVSYRWDFNMQDRKVENCTKSEIKYPQEAYCFRNTTFTQHKDFTKVGEHFDVDGYTGRVQHRDVDEFVEILVEGGSDPKNVLPVQEETRVKGGDRRETISGYSTRTYYDFSTAAIPEDTFRVPLECKL
jgi:hypothetical protein